MKPAHVNSLQTQVVPQVFKAIVDLKDDRGSTIHEIADQIRATLKPITNVTPKNVDGLVRKALKYGIKIGLFREDAQGKFIIIDTLARNQNLTPKEYFRIITNHLSR